MATLPDGTDISLQHEESWDTDPPVMTVQHEENWNTDPPSFTEQFDESWEERFIVMNLTISADKSSIAAGETVTLSGSSRDDEGNLRDATLKHQLPDGSIENVATVRGDWSEDVTLHASGDHDFWTENDRAGLKHTEEWES